MENEEKADKAAIGKIDNRVDLLEKQAAKFKRQFEQVKNNAETFTGRLDKTDVSVNNLAAYVAKLEQENETLKHSLSDALSEQKKFGEKIIETNTMLNRLNNTVAELARKPGSYPSETRGSVLGRTDGGQIFWFASGLSYAEAKEATDKEKAEHPGWSFTFIPFIPSKSSENE